MPGICACRQRGDRSEDPSLHRTFAKAGRERKILIDYLRNNRTNTSICAFSPRARPGGDGVDAPGLEETDYVDRSDGR